MKRALVLNAGAAWAAYQIGALRHLIRDQKYHFELCAGTGIGAMNAAFVACNEFDALESFWKHIGWRKLVSINWKTPWREGPCVAKLQRKFISKYVSETKLVEAGTKLVFSCLNLQTGREEILSYPGCQIPLIDGLMGAVALPGLSPPLQKNGNQQLVEGTFVNGFLLRTVALQYPVEEIFAVAVISTRVIKTQPLPKYNNWRTVMDRAIKMNQSHDVWSALADTDKLASAAAAYQYVSEQIPNQLANRIKSPELREQLRSQLAKVYEQSTFPIKRIKGPVVYAITPSQAIDYAIWQFRRKDLEQTMELGYSDAKTMTQKISAKGG